MKSFFRVLKTYLTLNKMKIVEIKRNITRFDLYKNIPVYIYDDYFTIGKIKYPIDGDEYVSVESDVLEKYKRGGNHLMYTNGDFKPIIEKYSQPTFFEENVWIEYSYLEDKNANVRFMEHGKEKLFSLKTSNGLHSPRYIKEQSVFLFNDPSQKYLLACSKNGDFLWQYTEEADDLKINWCCIPVADDVVVVISLYGARPKKIQGFNIRTGERLWKIESEAKYEPDTFFMGEDKMLYGCRGYVIRPGIGVTKLNPFTGELEVSLINNEEVFDFMPWNVTMHDRQLYFVDNRRGNEIGVIDVDKRELIERAPLNIKKKVTIGAPVVTDDKVYVFIRDLKELRVYDK